MCQSRRLQLQYLCHLQNNPVLITPSIASPGSWQLQSKPHRQFGRLKITNYEISHSNFVPKYLCCLPYHVVPLPHVPRQCSVPRQLLYLNSIRTVLIFCTLTVHLLLPSDWNFEITPMSKIRNYYYGTQEDLP